MIRLTKKQILMLHSQMIRVYGGSDGIRDEKLRILQALNLR